MTNIKYAIFPADGSIASGTQSIAGNLKRKVFITRVELAIFLCNLLMRTAYIFVDKDILSG